MTIRSSRSMIMEGIASSMPWLAVEGMTTEALRDAHDRAFAGGANKDGKLLPRKRRTVEAPASMQFALRDQGERCRAVHSLHAPCSPRWRPLAVVALAAFCFICAGRAADGGATGAKDVDGKANAASVSLGASQDAEFFEK